MDVLKSHSALKGYMVWFESPLKRRKYGNEGLRALLQVPQVKGWWL